MLTRVVTSVVAIAILLPILIFSGTVAGQYIFITAMGILTFVSVYEICGCFGVRKNLYISIPSYIYVVAVTLISIFWRESEHYIGYIVCAGFVFLFAVFALAMFHMGKVTYAQVAALASTTFYISCGFLSIINLRYIEYGQYLYLLVFIGAWATDTGAYFVGVLFGKHKLIPHVSPKKTVEGAFGGILGCVIGYLIFGFCMEKIYSLEANYIALACVAAVIAIISQIGDLIASYIKREHNIKDYGNIFPGHGGVLDRFDSIIAVAPFILGIVIILGVKLIA